MPTSLNGARAPSASLVKKWKERDSTKGRTPRLPTCGTNGTTDATDSKGGGGGELGPNSGGNAYQSRGFVCGEALSWLPGSHERWARYT